jgi:hypothetical protein
MKTVKSDEEDSDTEKKAEVKIIDMRAGDTLIYNSFEQLMKTNVLKLKIYFSN